MSAVPVIPREALERENAHLRRREREAVVMMAALVRAAGGRIEVPLREVAAAEEGELTSIHSPSGDSIIFAVRSDYGAREETR